MVSSVGEQLKHIRESRGISLDEVAQRTHIPANYLRALEEGDDESIPSGVQLRGFLRLYASELGVELEDLRVSDYHLYPRPKLSTPKEPTEDPTNELSVNAPDDDPQDLDEQEHQLEPAVEVEPEKEADQTAQLLSQEDVNQQAIPSFEAPKPKSSIEIFQSIGTTLKQRRELLSLSIQSVHESTHIQEQHLLSLESGAMDQLPSPVHTKGMLDNYADFLSLDTEALLLDFSAALQLQRHEKETQLKRRGRRPARELSPSALRFKNFFTLDLLVISVLFFTFAAFVFWGVNRILAEETSSVPDADIPAVSDILLATETPVPLIQDNTEVIEIDADQAEQIADADEEGAGNGLDPELTAAPINIILQARQRLWVEVTSDGLVVFQGRLIPGNVYDFSAQEQLDILTGNIGSLQIILNNVDLGSQGSIGQVANLTFTENGLITAPPSPDIPQTTPTTQPEDLDD